MTMPTMPIKILIIAIIYNLRHDAILLRIKPKGAPPYSQRTYLFGAELKPPMSIEAIEAAAQAVVRFQTGIEVRLLGQTSWGVEVKVDPESGETTQFVFLNGDFEQVGGELVNGDPAKIERVEWGLLTNLADYDHVPPSVTLLKSRGLL